MIFAASATVAFLCTTAVSPVIISATLLHKPYEVKALVMSLCVTIPTSRPSSRTGNRLMRFSSMILLQSRIEKLEAAHSTGEDIASTTFTLPKSIPLTATFLRRSLSVSMPVTTPSSKTTTQDMFRRDITFAAEAKVSSEDTVATSLLITSRTSCQIREVVIECSGGRFFLTSPKERLL